MRIPKIASSHLQRTPRLLRDPPVDAFQQHRQLRLAEMHFAIVRRWPYKPPALKPLGKQAGALAIPPDDLEQVSASATEHKQVAAERIFRQRLLCQCGKPAKAFAHVGHACGQPHSGRCRNRDHVVRRSARSTFTSDGSSTSPRQISLAPQCSMISISERLG